MLGSPGSSSERDSLAGTLFLSAIKIKVSFKSNTYGGVRKEDQTEKLELKWPYNVVPNRGKKPRPLYISHLPGIGCGLTQGREHDFE